MWRVFRDLNDSTVDRFMTKIGELQTAFWLRYRTSYNIKLVETGKVVLWHSKLGGNKRLIKTQADAREWLEEKDEICLDKQRLDRPYTK